MHPWAEMLRDKWAGVVRSRGRPDQEEIAEEMSALSDGYEPADIED